MPCPCQLCASTNGTIHLTRLDGDGARTELHLCRACATRLEFTPEQPPDIEGIAAAIATAQQSSSETSSDSSAATATVSVTPGAACPNCGLEFTAYVQSNLFGCPECYQAFAQQVDELARAYHGTTAHAGRLPRPAGGDATRAQRAAARQALELALNEAVQREQFERAAQLRDQLAQLKASAKTPRSPRPRPDPQP